MRNSVALLLAAMMALAAVPAQAATTAQKPVSGQNIMTWTQEERTILFRNLDQTVPTALVKRGEAVRSLPRAAQPLDVRYTHDGKSMDIAAYMAANSATGLLILKDGQILAEHYALGRTAQDRWTAWSVTKSVTSTLVGAAIKDGAIASVDEPVTRYLPELKGSAYDGVTIRHLLLMASGVKWGEDYESKTDDFFRMLEQPFLAQMKTLPRQDPPGTKFHYNTGDTNLLGLIVSRAVRKPLSQYLSEKIWVPYGMESDATWWLNHGEEVAGANLNITLRDFARFGQFILEGGRINGQSILPDGWIAQASSAVLPTGWANAPGYGYKWWIKSPDAFMALGIFGQTIYIEPKKNLVIVLNHSWPRADNSATYALEIPFLNAVSAAAE